MGHAAGLDDLYWLEAGWETMFGTTLFGVRKMRDLFYGDKVGIRKLYWKRSQ